jgi:uncharacterized protein
MRFGITLRMERDASINPFRYGALALDDAFTDREREASELVADALAGQDVVVFAPRRYGKSSLVWKVARDLVRKKALVAQLDLMKAPSKEKLAEKLAAAIHEDIASPLFRAKERLQVFGGLRVTPSVSVSPEDGSLSFGFSAAREEADLDATIERLLELPAEIGASRGRKVVLVFDEFQEIADIDPRLLKLMRSVFQEQPEVAHLYLGSKRHMMDRIFDDANEPFWRSAKKLELDVIEPAAFRGHLEKRFRATRRTIDRDALDALLASTGGHPYATQELCYFLWQATPEGEAASRARLDEALERVLRSEHAHFSLIWDKASSVQRLLLEALAYEPGRPYAGDYRRRNGLPPASSVQRALTTLDREELVGRAGQGWRVTEPFLAEWIQVNVGS